MKQFARNGLLALVLATLVAKPALAKAWDDSHILATTLIEISDYDQTTHSYLVRLQMNRAIGPLYAAPEDLSASIPAFDLAHIRKVPASILGGQHVVDKPLAILSDDHLAARRAEFKKRVPASDQ